MRTKALGMILVLLQLLSGCSTVSSSPSSTILPPDSNSSIKDAEPSVPNKPEAWGDFQILSAENLSMGIKNDLQMFEDQNAKSLDSSKEYIYLYVVDQNGVPISNIQCYPGDIDWSVRWHSETDMRSGLSRNSGILPIPISEFVDTDSAVLYLCNGDTEIPFYEEPVFQKVELSGDVLNQLKSGEIVQVVWNDEKPIDTISKIEHITVTVKSSDGQPAANKIVYIHFPASSLQPDPTIGDIGFIDSPYEPRYTDENGIARFGKENTFGSNPSGEREIVVLPSYGDFDISLKKTVHIDVPSAPPWDFEIVLD